MSTSEIMEALQIVDLESRVAAHLEAAGCHDHGHRLFPMQDWRYEIEKGDTTLGYMDWLEGNIQFETDIVIDEIHLFLHQVVNSVHHAISEVQFAEEVIDSFSTLRIVDDDAVDRIMTFMGKKPDKPLFGETFGSVPSDIAFDLSRLVHVCMETYEGIHDAGKVIEDVEAFIEKNAIEEVAIQDLLEKIHTVRRELVATGPMPDF